MTSTLPGLSSARHLLEVGCAEPIVMRMLIVEVGLTDAEATTAIDAAHLPGAV